MENACLGRWPAVSGARACTRNRRPGCSYSWKFSSQAACALASASSSDWLPSMEDLAAGVASAVYGPGQGAICGLSAARAHGAIPRAFAAGFVLGPTQHRPMALVARSGLVHFSKRDLTSLSLDYLDTAVGPGLTTSVAQTILDLARGPLQEDDTQRGEAIRNLMHVVDDDELAELADRVRGRAALVRARRLVARDQ